MLFIRNTYNMWDKFQTVAPSNEQKGDMDPNSGKTLHRMYWQKLTKKFQIVNCYLKILNSQWHSIGTWSVRFQYI